MKHKITLRNPEELIVGTRIKIPIAGWFLGSKKRQIWYKGTSLEYDIALINFWPYE